MRSTEVCPGRPHGPGPSPDFAESSFDCICGSHLAALFLRFVAEAGEQFVELVTQAGNGCRIVVAEAVSELPCGGTRRPGRELNPYLERVLPMVDRAACEKIADEAG